MLAGAGRARCEEAGDGVGEAVVVAGATLPVGVMA